MNKTIVKAIIAIFYIVGVPWVLYRIVMSFENGLINGMIHLIVLGASTWVITYIWQYYK